MTSHCTYFRRRMHHPPPLGRGCQAVHRVIYVSSQDVRPAGARGSDARERACQVPSLGSVSDYCQSRPPWRHGTGTWRRRRLAVWRGRGGGDGERVFFLRERGWVTFNGPILRRTILGRARGGGGRERGTLTRPILRRRLHLPKVSSSSSEEYARQPLPGESMVFHHIVAGLCFPPCPTTISHWAVPSGPGAAG
jgi:hypothetical protein